MLWRLRRTLAPFYASAITAWELGVAELKRTGRPELGMTPGAWLRQALRTTNARLATIMLAIAAEAASGPVIYSRGDPGDCFLIATAPVRPVSSDIAKTASTQRGCHLQVIAGHGRMAWQKRSGYNKRARGRSHHRPVETGDRRRVARAYR